MGKPPTKLVRPNKHLLVEPQKIAPPGIIIPFSKKNQQHKLKPTQFDFLIPMWIARLQDFSWPVEAPRSRNVIAIIPAYPVLNSSNIHWLSHFLALAGSWCCTCLYQHAMFNKKIHPSDSCQQKNIRKYTWSPEQQKSNIFPSVSPAPEPGAHFRPGTMSRAQPFRWAIFLCGDNSTAFGNKRAPTHTQTSLNIISKNISQIQDIHAFLRWQNRNHPIWRISAVEPSLVDVSNAYLYSVSAWKNASFIKHQWLENLQAAGTSLPTGRSQGQTPPKEGHSIQHTCFYLPSSWVDIGGNYPTMSYHRKRGTALYNWACQFLCKSISACEIIIIWANIRGGGHLA